MEHVAHTSSLECAGAPCSICQWDNLDFERGFITLRGTVAKKGKTETIPLNDQARTILTTLPRTKSPYVFPGRYDDKPRGNITDMLRRVKEKAGLPESFRPLHGLRHSFASWLASSGRVSMYELQQLLTHSSPQMTQRYAHLHDDALRKASGVASALFGAVQNNPGAPSSQNGPDTLNIRRTKGLFGKKTHDSIAPAPVPVSNWIAACCKIALIPNAKDT